MHSEEGGYLRYVVGGPKKYLDQVRITIQLYEAPTKGSGEAGRGYRREKYISTESILVHSANIIYT